MTIILVPPGRGRWSPVVLSYDSRVRDQLPLPLSVRVGQRVEILGRVMRVQAVLA